MNYTINEIRIFIKQEIKKGITKELLKYGFNAENEKKTLGKIYVPMKVLIKELKVRKTTMDTMNSSGLVE